MLPEGEAFRPELDEDGLLEQIQLDLGQVISATPRRSTRTKPGRTATTTSSRSCRAREILIEYTAHPEACFHLSGRGQPSSRCPRSKAPA